MATIPAEGSKAYYSSDGNTYTEITQLISVTPPSLEVPEVETTVLSDTAKSFRPGKITGPGEFAFRIMYDPAVASHTALATLVTTPANRYWKFEYNDTLTNSATDTFQGFITGWEPGDAEDEANIEVDITVRINGATTRNAGS
jgi:hypothetical protein